VTPPNWTTTTTFAKEISKAIDRMSFEEKVAFRFAVLLKYAETRRRLLN
jgi:hypothetical protein